MAASLASIQAKIARAERIADELERHNATMFEHYEMWSEFDATQGRWLSRARTVDELPWDDWTFQAGDAIRELRTSLDHLAHLLAGPDAGRHTAFPITDTSKNWRGAITPRPSGLPRTHGMDPEAIKRIRALQPYTGHEAGKTLGSLRDLDDAAKHRAQQVTVSSFTVSHAHFDGLLPADGPARMDWWVGVFDDDTVLIASPTQPNVKMEYQVTFQMGYGLDTARPHYFVVPFLREGIETVRDRVLPRLSPYIRST